MSDQRVKLKNVRLAFGDGIFRAKAVNEGDKPSYNCCFLLPPDHPDLPKLKAAIKAAATAKWGAKADEVLKALVAGDKVCLRKGDAKGEYEGFPGNLYISARNRARPLVVDADGATPLTEADGRPYSGCFVNASIDVWAQQNSYGKRINAQLRGVQFFRDGDSFGGGAPATPDEFDDVSADAADGDAPAEGDDGAFGDFI